MAFEDRPPDDSPESTAVTEEGAESRRRGRRREGRGTMIPARAGRTLVETFVMRLVATAGIIGIGVAIAAIMRSSNSQGWLIGAVVSVVSVILAALLWSSRRL